MRKNVPGSGNSLAGGPASRERLVFGRTDASSVRVAEYWVEEMTVEEGRDPAFILRTMGSRPRAGAWHSQIAF